MARSTSARAAPPAHDEPRRQVRVGEVLVERDRAEDLRGHVGFRRDARGACAYEMVGDLNKAEEAYRAAEKIEPKPLYVKAVGLIKQEKEKQRKRNQAASQ